MLYDDNSTILEGEAVEEEHMPVPYRGKSMLIKNGLLP
jgi:hypothetical protein